MAKGIPTERFKQVEVTSKQGLLDWLADNHTQTENIWLVTYKKHRGDTYVSVDDILDAVISYGWVDGIRRKVDEDRTMQIIGPRHTQAWAKSYKDRAARLIAEGVMRPAGQAAIEAAKANGLWDYWADVDALIEPADLASALDANARARADFDARGDSYKRNLLRWIKLAKTEETRRKRITQIVDFAARSERIPQM